MSDVTVYVSLFLKSSIDLFVTKWTRSDYFMTDYLMRLVYGVKFSMQHFYNWTRVVSEIPSTHGVYVYGAT